MLKELREKQARIATNARAKFDEIKDDTPAERAADIEREFDAMMAEHDQIGERIARAEKLEKAERAANAGDERRPNAGGEGRGRDEGEKTGYREVFHRFMARGGSVDELTVEERAVLRGGVQPQAEFRAQSVGTTTAGGYTVPTELAAIIVTSMAAWGPMYDEDIGTTLVTASGAPIDLPTVDDTSKTGAIHTEGADMADDGSQDVTFGKKTLSAYVYDTEFIKWSMELAQDSIFNFEQLLGDLLGERLGRLANTALTTGTGSSQPQGVVVGSTLGKTAAGAAAITGDELIDLVHSVNPAYRTSPKSRFMFNDLTLAVIRKLKDGQGNYLWQMGDVTKGEPGSLLGYRYSVNQAMASVETGQKSVLFGDFSKFYVRKVGAPVLGVMRERFWPNLGIAGLIRFDGRLADTAAVKHLIQA